MWITTAGTAIAERLDAIANPPSSQLRQANNGKPARTSRVDDLLAAILVRHHLNTKTIEINYHPETIWESTAQDDPPPF